VSDPLTTRIATVSRAPDSVNRDVRGFLHVCCLGAYRDVTGEIVHALLESRLYDRSVTIEVGVLGDGADQRVVEALIKPFPRFRIAFRSSDFGEYEFPTLGLLQDACRTWDGPVYYLHTKGVSRSSYDQYSRYWRQLMLDEVVYNHERCLAELTTADAVGTNWYGNHYSGNFWWAQPSHIRGLPDVRSAQRPAHHEARWQKQRRMPCEFWLTTSPGRFASVGYSGNLNLYDALRWTASVADIANELLTARTSRRFAELSMDGPSPHYGAVVADSKLSISSRPHADSLSEESFLTADTSGGGYDVILLAAQHEPEHCLDVIEGCLLKLSADGVLVVHHSNPPSAWHQRPAEESGTGSEWTGQVWRAVVTFRMRHPHCEVFTVDTDWGCTVLRPNRQALNELGKTTFDVLDWNAFVRERNTLLNLVSVSWFRRHLYADPYLAGSTKLFSKTQLLNVLISVDGLDSCLLAGVADQNLTRIIAPIRQSVGPYPEATYQITPDEFFSGGTGLDYYDLIVIDCRHDAAPCRRGLENALARLSNCGWIVVYGVNDAGSKVLADLCRQRPELAFYTLALDDICALVRRRTGNPQADLGFEAPRMIDASAEGLRNLFGSERAGGPRRIDAALVDGRDPNMRPQPYAGDRGLLSDEVERNPNDVRSVFYLAQSYFDSGDFVNSRRWYARQLELRKPWWPGLDEEYYVAMYRLAASMAQLGEPWPDIREAYLNALEFRPARAEAAYAIACFHRINKRYQLGYLFAKLAAETPLPEHDTVCVHADVHGWLAADEQAVCAFWLGKHDEAFTICRRLLARPEIPASQRERIAVNRDYSAPIMIEGASSYPDGLARNLIAGPPDAEVTVSLIAGPDHAVFEQTLNSFLNCCNDLARVGRFVVLDTGLSAQDRAMLKERYGFLEFADCRPDAQLARIREQIGGRFWLHLGQGWRFFAPDNLITRLTAVFDAEPRVFQVGINFADAAKLTGTCAAEDAVHRTPDSGRYVLANVMNSGPAMFDTARLDRVATEELHTATLDEVLCITAT
jgi:tetratricopeptide (TPR) repeat protein